MIMGEEPRSYMASGSLVLGGGGWLLSENDGKMKVKVQGMFLMGRMSDATHFWMVFDGFELHWGPPINDGHKDKH